MRLEGAAGLGFQGLAPGVAAEPPAGDLGHAQAAPGGPARCRGLSLRIEVGDQAVRRRAFDECAGVGLPGAFGQMGAQGVQLALAVLQRAQSIAHHLAGPAVAAARDPVLDEGFPKASQCAPRLKRVFAIAVLITLVVLIDLVIRKS